MTSTQDETGPDDGVVLLDDSSPEERLEIIGELLHQIEPGLLAVAGDISCEDIELLAFVYDLAGLPDEGIELICTHCVTNPDD